MMNKRIPPRRGGIKSGTSEGFTEREYRELTLSIIDYERGSAEINREEEKLLLGSENACRRFIGVHLPRLADGLVMWFRGRFGVNPEQTDAASRLEPVFANRENRLAFQRFRAFCKAVEQALRAGIAINEKATIGPVDRPCLVPALAALAILRKTHLFMAPYLKSTNDEARTGAAAILAGYFGARFNRRARRTMKALRFDGAKLLDELPGAVISGAGQEPEPMVVSEIRAEFRRLLKKTGIEPEGAEGETLFQSIAAALGAGLTEPTDPLPLPADGPATLSPDEQSALKLETLILATKLSKQQRRVVELVREGVTPREIARLLKMTPGNVAKTKHEALKKLAAAAKRTG